MKKRIRRSRLISKKSSDCDGLIEINEKIMGFMLFDELNIIINAVHQDNQSRYIKSISRKRGFMLVTCQFLNMYMICISRDICLLFQFYLLNII